MSEKRRALGRGLGALIPNAPTSPNGRPVDVFFPDSRPGVTAYAGGSPAGEGGQGGGVAVADVDAVDAAAPDTAAPGAEGADQASAERTTTDGFDLAVRNRHHHPGGGRSPGDDDCPGQPGSGADIRSSRCNSRRQLWQL